MPIRSRDELFQKADQFIIRRYDDGRIDGIDAYRKRRIIHSTQVIYAASGGLTRIANVNGFLFPEVWNSLETPELNWYDRNPKNVTNSYFAINGPGGATSRWSYTVPTRRKAYVESLNLSVRRVTAPTVAAVDQVYIMLNSILLAKAFLISPAGTTIDNDSWFSGQNVLLQSGDVLEAFTHIQSDANSYAMINMKATEFDA